MRKRNPFRSFRKGGIDDVSVSDSLCSGVLRDMIGDSTNSLRSTVDSSGGALFNSGRDVMGASAKSAQSAPNNNNKNTMMPGGVADFNSNYDRKHSDASSLSQGFTPQHSLTSRGTGDNDGNASQEALSLADDAIRREARKEKVKEKLDKYKRDQKQLKQSCFALEQQLAQTTEKLKEVDSKAAFRIDTLEGALRETRSGMERVAKSSSREVCDQSECIKTLGKKLIRQAHVIKRQKNAVEQYKNQLQAMQEEMAMQDERDSYREDDYEKLKADYEALNEQKVQTQNLLQENIEEMKELKAEAERDAKRVMELEFNVQQKDATLDRVAKEAAEKATHICQLEDDLEDKRLEAQGATERLMVTEAEVKVTKRDLEKAKSELEKTVKEAEEIRCNYSTWKDAGEGGNALGNSATNLNNAADKLRIFRGFGAADSEEMDEETFEAELHAKDETITSLDDTVKEHESTIQSLKSDMVKMSHTYKQESYIKRKEIAQLKQRNAEYALKLRALEKAFKKVNATQNMSLTTSGNFHGHTMHGASSAGNKQKLGGSSMHGTPKHGHSTHSMTSIESKEDKAAAVKARLGGGLGGLAPYEFPSKAQLQQDSQIVTESNFFEHDQDISSEDGRKGELPEEC